MKFNSFIYPAPKSSYSAYDIEKLILIPKIFQQIKLNQSFKYNQSLISINFKQSEEYQNKEEFIPCHFLEFHEGSDIILLIFHGNAEDLGSSEYLNDLLRIYLRVHVLAIEYPGYGIYKGKSNEENILKDAETVYDYLVQQIGFKDKQILILGKSVGTGPATHLAAHRNPRALVLLTPYTSIQDCAVSIVGSICRYILTDQMRNIDKIQQVECPVCYIHGKQDEIIPYQHSIDLSKLTKLSYIHISEQMRHNDFDFFDDLIHPIIVFIQQKNFFNEFNIEVESDEKNSTEKYLLQLKKQTINYNIYFKN